jgi:hypothetical protein
MSVFNLAQKRSFPPLCLASKSSKCHENYYYNPIPTTITVRKKAVKKMIIPSEPQRVPLRRVSPARRARHIVECEPQRVPLLCETLQSERATSQRASPSERACYCYIPTTQRAPAITNEPQRDVLQSYSYPQRVPACPSESQRVIASSIEPQWVPASPTDPQRTPASPIEAQWVPASPKDPQRPPSEHQRDPSGP